MHFSGQYLPYIRRGMHRRGDTEARKGWAPGTWAPRLPGVASYFYWYWARRWAEAIMRWACSSSCAPSYAPF